MIDKIIKNIVKYGTSKTKDMMVKSTKLTNNQADKLVRQIAVEHSDKIKAIKEAKPKINRDRAAEQIGDRTNPKTNKQDLTPKDRAPSQGAENNTIVYGESIKDISKSSAAKIEALKRISKAPANTVSARQKKARALRALAAAGVAGASAAGASDKYASKTLSDELGVKKTPKEEIAKSMDARAQKKELDSQTGMEDMSAMIMPVGRLLDPSMKVIGKSGSKVISYIKKKLSKATPKEAVKLKAQLKQVEKKMETKPDALTRAKEAKEAKEVKKKVNNATSKQDEDNFVGGIEDLNNDAFNVTIARKIRDGKKLTPEQERVMKSMDNYISDKTKQTTAKDLVRVAKADNMALSKLKEGDVMTNKSHTFTYGAKDTIENFPHSVDKKLKNVKYKIKQNHDAADVGDINPMKRGQTLLKRDGKYKVTKKEEVPARDEIYYEEFQGFRNKKRKEIPAHTVVHLEQLPKDVVKMMTPEEKKKVVSGVLSVAGISAIVEKRKREEKKKN